MLHRLGFDLCVDGKGFLPAYAQGLVDQVARLNDVGDPKICVSRDGIASPS